MSTIVALPPMRWIGDRPVRRITVPEFEAMIGAGIFGKRDRLELIEGVLVGKMVKGERHSAGVGRSWRAVDRDLPAGWHVRVEMPIAVTGATAGPSPTWPWPGARSTTTCGSAGRPGAGTLRW